MSEPKLAIFISASLWSEIALLYAELANLLKPCRVAAMRGSAADRIDDLIANHKIDVRTIGP